MASVGFQLNKQWCNQTKVYAVVKEKEYFCMLLCSDPQIYSLVGKKEKACITHIYLSTKEDEIKKYILYLLILKI